MERNALFQPIKIGNMVVRNRIVMTPICLSYNLKGGLVSPQTKAFYAARAKDGVGLIIPGTITFSDEVRRRRVESAFMMMDHNAKPGLTELAEIVHAFGGKIIMQVSLGMGHQTSSKDQWPDPDADPIAASEMQLVVPLDSEPRKAVEWHRRRGREFKVTHSKGLVAREATVAEIEEIEDTQAEGSLGLKTLGFDGMEIHVGHGYFGAGFLSPRINRRTDKYGGSREKRMTFLKEMYNKVRAKVGNDFVIGMRIGISEHVPGGQTLEDTIYYCQEMEKLGLNYITLTDGCYEAFRYFLPEEDGTMLEGAAAIKKAVKIPIICPSLHDPDMAEKAIAEGKTDMISLLRPLLADTHWVSKARAGLRPVQCTRCLSGCWGRLQLGLPVRCEENPEVGFEQYNPEYYVPIPQRSIASCHAACPVGNDVRGFVNLISENNLSGALALIRQTSPFPAVCGRVCPHPCEGDCNRKEVEAAVSIRSLERLAADYGLSAKEEVTPVPRTKEDKVAVVGSGPAGLSAAYFLAKKGYPITVFEAESVPGGIMALGIPEYRLPKKIVQAEIEAIKQLGVEIKLNSLIGKDGMSVLKKQGYEAIFLAVGARDNMKLGIEGEELDGVLQGLSFLKDINQGREVKLGKKVVVIGGGNVAMDVALTTLRKGAQEVQIVCLEHSKEEMPAFDDEIGQAIEEGITINMSWGPRRIVGSGGKVTGLELKRCVSVFDEAGKFNPRYDEKKTKSIDADTVITAIGQKTDLTFLPAGNKYKVTKQGTLEVDARSLATNIAGVFGGGDVVSGPATVVEAIAAGKRAAVSIDSYLQRKSLPIEKKPAAVTFEEIGLGEVERRERIELFSISLKERAHNFKEVNLGLSAEMGVQEAGRCLSCNARPVWRV